MPIWSTNVTYTTALPSVEAILLDDGNLILHKIFDSTKLLLQSFDYPTNMFLHRSKLGYNKITKTKKRRTSSRNAEDPSQGLFSFELDPSDNSFIMLSSSSRKYYWTSGPWNGEIFSLVPEMRLNHLCYFNFVSNVNESYLTHTIIEYPILFSFCWMSRGK